VPASSPHPLRPAEHDALEAWRAIIEAEAAQVERVREPEPPGDFYAPIAGRFRPGGRASLELDVLLDLAQDGDTWLDIGAGGGRLTIPIAERVARVVALDPSESMRDTLRAAASEAKRDNLEIVDGRWPVEGWDEAVDVTLAAHSIYDIADIGPFLDAMERHSRRLCVAVLGQFARGAQFGRLFEALHGEPVIALPALKEFVAVLGARNRRYEVRTVGSGEAIELHEHDDAYAFVRRLMWLTPDSDKDRRMRELLDDWYGTPDGLALPSARPFIGIVSWEPPPA
jgi:SAM-dependent methyltransferase